MPPGTARARDVALKAKERMAVQGILMPAPTTELNSGQDARVFNTTDNQMVVRVGRMDRSEETERLLLSPDFQGGVVSVKGMVQIEDFLVTWKERLDTNVTGWIWKNYNNHEGNAVAAVLLNLCTGHRPKHQMAVLLSHPATRGLALAIQKGLPTQDLDLESNLGVTADGRIVAFDL